MNSSSHGDGMAARVVRLRPSVSFAPLDDGMMFKDWDRSFQITGNPSIYTLFERLLPHLVRGVPRAALLAAVPQAVRAVVAMLLDKLDEHQMCFVVSDDRPVDRDAEVFAQAIAFLEATAAAPYQAFARVRRARVALVGGGDAYFAALRALATTGVGRLECFTPTDRVPTIERELARHEQVASQIHTCQPDEVPGADLGAFELVLHLRDQVASEQIKGLARATDRPLLQGVVTPDLGLAGPLRVDTQRLSAGLEDTLARSRHSLVAGPERPHAPVLAALLGNAVAFEAFKYLAGESTPTASSQAIVVTLEPLEVSHHPIIALVRDTPEQPLAALSSTLADMRAADAPLDTDARVEHLRALANESFGILELPHPGDLPQVPIFTSRVTSRYFPGEAVGFADTPTQAYLNAGRAGLSRLADSVCTARTLPTLALDGTAPARPMARADMSLGVGDHYQAWLEHGLYRHLARAFTDPEHAPYPVSVRALDFADLAGACARRWKTLTLRFGARVTAVHGILPAVPGVHLAAIALAGQTAGVAAGHGRDDALEGALQQALARAELGDRARSWLPAYPPVPVPVDAAVDTEPDSWHTSGSLDHTLAALASQGKVVLVHPWQGIPDLARLGWLVGWVGIDDR